MTTFREWRNEFVQPLEIQAENFEAALVKAVENSEGYRFRTNREVLDFLNNFIQFSYEGKVYIAKKAIFDKAIIERNNAEKASIVLSNSRIMPVVPSIYNIAGSSFLVTNYRGQTLHETMFSLSRKEQFQTFELLLAQLIETDTQWVGFAPRNLITQEDSALFFAIDWEEIIPTSRSKKWLPSTLFKIALNWSYLFETPYHAYEFLEKRVKPDFSNLSLDKFEVSFLGLVGKKMSQKEAFHSCVNISFISEAPTKVVSSDLMTPQEIGHLISDLFGSPIDVWYASQLSYVRKNVTNRIDIFLEFFTRRLEKVLNCSCSPEHYKAVKKNALQSILCLADTKFDWVEGDINKNTILVCLKRLDSLQTKRGLKAAIARSHTIDELMCRIWSSCRHNFGWNNNTQLILRGSAGQGLLSIKSDVDFEISSPDCPEGQPSWEALFRTLMGAANVESEGSSGRPKERDISGKTWSRDIAEWLELRSICSDGKSVPWLFMEVARNSASCDLGIFESTGLTMTPKNLWFATRTLISRLAMALGQSSPLTIDQLSYLQKSKMVKEASRFEELLVGSLQAYENGSSEKLESIFSLLQDVASQHNLPTPIFLAR
ncbi:hypothetical protein GFK91_31645 (plasmid) [Roseibium aggregatum]|uniref:hypothetical protein n=1 Tax=Roseibium aggregatum TaxID=187304 RepID=UPI001E60228F|nr:hypothetical protein [Roseibium aggregatum]UES60267.1 hypothetical protein GFK91_31645 [Roseibium aggregatum]